MTPGVLAASLASPLAIAVIAAVAVGVVWFAVWSTRSERRVHELARVIRRDPLTGVADRRSWDEELARELARARRRGHDFAIGFLHLDRFESYTRAHGRQAGDGFLRAAASQWQARLRSTDILARHQGAAFALLLADCHPAHAGAVVERIRAATPKGPACFGGSAAWDGEESGEALIARAELALFTARRAAGRAGAGGGPAEEGDQLVSAEAGRPASPRHE